MVRFFQISSYFLHKIQSNAPTFGKFVDTATIRDRPLLARVWYVFQFSMKIMLYGMPNYKTNNQK